LDITVCHMPPGASKWNRIEHRLFSHTFVNWRGRPLTSHDVIMNSIAATTTRTGLTVHAELDPGTYDTGIKVTDSDVDAPPMHRHRSTATGTAPSIPDLATSPAQPLPHRWPAAPLRSPAPGACATRSGARDRAAFARAFGSVYEEVIRTQLLHQETTGQGQRVIVPVTNRGDAIGLLELLLPTHPDADALDVVKDAAHILAYVVIADCPTATGAGHTPRTRICWSARSPHSTPTSRPSASARFEGRCPSA
jgi:hypothetical protein